MRTKWLPSVTTLPMLAEAKEWNLNNAQIELCQWRKFSGIAGRL